MMEGLSEDEIKRVREILEKEARVVWFWATVRQWAAWCAAVATAVYFLRDAIAAAFKVLFK